MKRLLATLVTLALALAFAVPALAETRSFRWDIDGDGVDEYLVQHDTVKMEFIVNELVDGAYSAKRLAVVFPVEADGKVDATRQILFYYEYAGFAVTRASDGGFAFRNLDTDAVITSISSGYPKMKAKFDSVFNALGFGFDGAKYITEEHFTKGPGGTSPEGAPGTGGSLPAPNPPQTGGAPSALGLALIALALFAWGYALARRVLSN